VSTAPPPLLLTSWALRSALTRGTLTPATLPGHARRLGFDGIETLDRQLGGFAPRQLELLLHQCRELSIPVVHDINCDLTLEDRVAQKHQVEQVSRQFDVAAGLGAKVVRICLGGQDASVQHLLGGHGDNKGRAASTGTLSMLMAQPAVRYLLQRLRQQLPARISDLDRKLGCATASLRELLPRADRAGVKIGIENHWGVSSRPEWIMQIVETVDSPLLGTCVDFGNFPRGIDPYQGIATLLTRALHVQAKGLDFDRAGNERRLNIGRCMGLVRDSGYDGPIGIEYEGAGNPLSGCLRLRDLVLRHWPA
jgi:sugar phosphate isomerase/epimerase